MNEREREREHEILYEKERAVNMPKAGCRKIRMQLCSRSHGGAKEKCNPHPPTLQHR